MRELVSNLGIDSAVVLSGREKRSAMFDDVLIESGGRDKHKGTWVTALVSAVVHIVLIGAIIAAGLYVHEKPEVVEKPIRAFFASAPPPPPPPPPPAASSSSVSTPKVTKIETPKTQPT